MVLVAVTNALPCVGMLDIGVTVALSIRAIVAITAVKSISIDLFLFNNSGRKRSEQFKIDRVL